MTLALGAADYQPNWWVLGAVFVICFLGPWVLAFRAANRNRPASRAELEARIRRVEQDEIVAAHRRRIEGTLD